MFGLPRTRRRSSSFSAIFDQDDISKDLSKNNQKQNKANSLLQSSLIGGYSGIHCQRRNGRIY